MISVYYQGPNDTVYRFRTNGNTYSIKVVDSPHSQQSIKGIIEKTRPVYKEIKDVNASIKSLNQELKIYLRDRPLGTIMDIVIE